MLQASLNDFAFHVSLDFQPFSSPSRAQNSLIRTFFFAVTWSIFTSDGSHTPQWLRGRVWQLFCCHCHLLKWSSFEDSAILGLFEPKAAQVRIFFAVTWWIFTFDAFHTSQWPRRGVLQLFCSYSYLLKWSSFEDRSIFRYLGAF